MDTVLLTLEVVVTRLGMVTYSPSIALERGSRLMDGLVRVLMRLLCMHVGLGEGTCDCSQPIQQVRGLRMVVLRCGGSRSAFGQHIERSMLFTVCACL
jgi:hypothetical protein